MRGIRGPIARALGVALGAGVMLGTTLALAQQPATGSVPMPVLQVQHDWGCEVLLCLSNPNGPKAVSQCEPPINRLYDELAHGHAFPSCTMSNGQNSQSAGAWVSLGWNFYDPCPAGMQPLPAGQYALPTSGAPRAMPGGAPLTVYAGIGDGSGIGQTMVNQGSVLPPLVCVGRQIGQQWVAIPTYIATVGASQTQTVSAGRYDAVTLVPPARSGAIFDVYVGGQLYRRVRW